MNILLLGSGGREHAFAWKIKQSPRCGRLFIAPGNAGTAALGTNLPVSPNDFPAVAAAALQNQIDLVLVGPEEPLVLGIRDYFQANPDLSNIPLIGPSREAAQLEGSKGYAKVFMQEMGIPTASYREFSPETLAQGLDYLSSHPLPVVLKADGLAAGKGVVICQNREEAQTELEAMLKGKFGEASRRVVVEAFLSGTEFSVFVLTDGKSYKILPVAKDYKRIGEGDTGLNTGGMGAVSPVPFANKELMQKVETRIIQPTMEGIKRRRLDYQGFIFLGLIEVNGEPFVIEYNCRMGDPETEAVLPRLKSDLLELLAALPEGRLDEMALEEDARAAATVVLVSGGYPGDYEKGKAISGLDRVDDSLVFHSGTRTGENGDLLTNGGRVLAITSYGKDLKEALEKSNSNAGLIQYEGKYFRRDIGYEF